MSAYQNFSDEELLALLRNGDSSGLDGLFRKYYEQLCLVSLRIVKDPRDAEDVVQEFFASLWRKRETMGDIGSPASYLRRSVRNRSLNFLRDQKRIPQGDEERMPDLATRDSVVSEKLEAKELEERITRAIDALPERCRLVFVLSRFEEMKQKDIAEKLNISTKTVENQMSRAYRFLREALSAVLLFFTCLAGFAWLSLLADQFIAYFSLAL